MFGSAILDVAIGLVFVFLLLSLICSAANELVETILKKRARNLEKGIKELITDDAFVAKLYNHGLINGLFRGNYETASKGFGPFNKLPSYIPAQNFALAVMDLTGKLSNPSIMPGPDKKEDSSKTDDTDARKADGIPEKVTQALSAFERATRNDAATFRKHVEDWYNSAMDRASGWYKRRTQWFIMALALVFAVVLNVDCIEIAKRLSNDSALRQGLVASAQAMASKQSNDNADAKRAIEGDLTRLNSLGLPIGWPERDFAKTRNQSPIAYWWTTVTHTAPDRALGWLLTALAASLGAPFWFDLLNKIIVVRSTVKPHEKSQPEASKDPTI
jgi:hypothetical protein